MKPRVEVWNGNTMSLGVDHRSEAAARKDFESRILNCMAMGMEVVVNKVGDWWVYDCREPAGEEVEAPVRIRYRPGTPG